MLLGGSRQVSPENGDSTNTPKLRGRVWNLTLQDFVSSQKFFSWGTTEAEF